MFKKILLGCATAICAMSLSLSIVNAEPREVEADGEYRLGDNDTRSQAKDLALDDAKKAALEKVAVYIESVTLVNDFQLTKQQIASYTNGKLQIKSKSFDFVEDGLVCKAHIVASVDIDEEELKNMPKLESDPQPTQPAQPAQPSEPIYQPPIYQPSQPVYQQPQRELFNVEEYNGHYYAVIDEGLDWRDADTYCRNLNGHLVTINSPAEQKFVQGLVFVNGKRNCYWLGGFQSVVRGDKWYWVDDSPFEYSNWADGQPDNLRETSLMMYRNPNPLSESSLGEWNDLVPSGVYATEPFFGLNNFGFVCEWDSRDKVRYN